MVTFFAGLPRFIPIEKMMDEKYLKMDTLYIKIKVDLSKLEEEEY